MTEAIGAITFYVRSGTTPIAGAKVYINSPGMSTYKYVYKGYTNAYGILGTWDTSIGINNYIVSQKGCDTVTGTVTVYENQNINANIYLTRVLLW